MEHEHHESKLTMPPTIEILDIDQEAELEQQERSKETNGRPSLEASFGPLLGKLPLELRRKIWGE